MKSRLRQMALVVGALCVVQFGTARVEARDAYQMVITIYNNTSVKLEYQLRVDREGGGPNDPGGWTQWQTYTHKHPGGYQYHTFRQVDRIQIRFDRIGGDGKFTEQIYDLDFNAIRADRTVGRRDGRPYRFEFDAGGRLLDLHRTEHNTCCW